MGGDATTVRPFFVTPAQVVGAGERGEVILLPPPPKMGGRAGWGKSPSVQELWIAGPLAGGGILLLREVYCY